MALWFFIHDWCLAASTQYLCGKRAVAGKEKKMQYFVFHCFCNSTKRNDADTKHLKGSHLHFFFSACGNTSKTKTWPIGCCASNNRNSLCISIFHWGAFNSLVYGKCCVFFWACCQFSCFLFFFSGSIIVEWGKTPFFLCHWDVDWWLWKWQWLHKGHQVPVEQTEDEGVLIGKTVPWCENNMLLL